MRLGNLRAGVSFLLSNVVTTRFALEESIFVPHRVLYARRVFHVRSRLIALFTLTEPVLIQARGGFLTHGLLVVRHSVFVYTNLLCSSFYLRRWNANEKNGP